MAFESWQAKNWDPEVGSGEFDEFCKRINHPVNSFEDAVEAIGADLDDAMALVDVPGFDFALLNYAAYVRAVSRPEVWLLLTLTTSIENPSELPEGSNSRTGGFCTSSLQLISDGEASSASGHSMIQSTRKRLWIRIGGSGYSRFAHSGVTSSYVCAPSGIQETCSRYTDFATRPKGPPDCLSFAHSWE